MLLIENSLKKYLRNTPWNTTCEQTLYNTSHLLWRAETKQRFFFFSWGFFASWQCCLLKFDTTIFPLLPSSVESGSAVLLYPHQQWDHYLSFVIFYMITLLFGNCAYYIYILIGSYYFWIMGKEIIYHISNFDLLPPYFLIIKLNFYVCTCLKDIAQENSTEIKTAVEHNHVFAS